ncbi:membrane protein insertion efficiency factor YidD [Aminivibrio sp.]
MTAAALVCTKLIRGYQIVVSPWLGDNCRFYPTCSQYALEALSLHGFFRGSLLAVKRICRCAPWSDGGYDPVPLPASRSYTFKDGDL